MLSALLMVSFMCYACTMRCVNINKFGLAIVFTLGWFISLIIVYCLENKRHKKFNAYAYQVCVLKKEIEESKANLTEKKIEKGADNEQREAD